MATTFLRKTFSGNGNRNTWTLSFWVKRGALGSQERLFSCEDSTSNDDDFFVFDNEDNLNLGFYSSGYYAQKETTRVFRDISGWYNIVITWDTTNGTAGDRLRLYVNGVRETSFASSTNPSSSANSFVNTTEPWEIGKRSYNDTQYFSGSMSHIHFIDGTAYDASAFGSIDATSGEWVINTSPSVTYGTNGFFILKDGNSVTDQSGEGNNWVVEGGTLTDLQDCPSDVFATLNPLDNYYQASTFTEGNNTVEHGYSNWTYNTSTLKIPEATKFYCEAKVITMYQNTCGIASNVTTGDGGSNTSLGNITGGVAFRGTQGDIQKEGSTVSGTWATFTTNDIIQIACDTVNNKLYFGKNGTWLNSGDPTSGASGTGAISITDNTDYFFAFGDNTSLARGKWSINFGNGYFGTTIISSEGTNASGIGKFEYDVPTGYTALSLKGLQE